MNLIEFVKVLVRDRFCQSDLIPSGKKIILVEIDKDKK